MSKNILKHQSSDSAKKRLDFIINHQSPLKVVQSTPVFDLLLTMREIGAESFLELAEMMKPEQVQELLDLEIWPGDRLDSKIAGNYFSLLFTANKDTAIKQLHGLDIELLGLMFKLVSDIYDLTLGEEPQDFPELYSKSPDNRFLVCFKDNEEHGGLKESLHQFLEELYGRDLKYSLLLLERVRFELASGLEEQSLHWRNSRMLDLGVLPREERLMFFAPLSIKALQKKAPAREMEATTSLSVVAKDFINYPFLYRASVDCLNQEDLMQGLSHVAMNMHASLWGDFGDKNKIYETSSYVKFLVELGLMQLCDGDMSHCGKMIDEYLISQIIRVGRTSLINLRKRLVDKIKDAQFMFGAKFSMLDSPLKEVASALILPEPRYYEGLLDVKKLTVRFFDHPKELSATIEAVNEILFRAEFIGLIANSRLIHLSHSAALAHHLIINFLGEDVPKSQWQKLLFNDGLCKDFTSFARNMVSELSIELKKISIHQPEHIDQRVNSFLNSILIQLEKNWSLLMDC